jgi:hypothetical protein
MPGFTVHAASFDGDERTDLFLHQAATGVWYKVLNTAAGFVYQGSQWLPWPIALQDLDGDRRSDVLIVNPQTGDFYKALTTWPLGFTYTSGQLR